MLKIVKEHRMNLKRLKRKKFLMTEKMRKMW